MLIIGPDAVEQSLTYAGLVEVLRAAFRDGAVQPVRHHHTIERPDGAANTLLLMPAWNDLAAAGTSAGGHIGIKIVTVAPDNGKLSKPAVMGNYMLLDAATGEPQAMIDGQKLTVWRTACASALAADYLARKDAKVQAQADIISCATLSTVPLVKGDLLRPGTHVDLVGAFSPTMRESDDAAMKRARVYVDTRAGATKEAGDIVLAMQAGAITDSDIIGDLFDLTRGKAEGRGSDDEITLFKSVGAALEDLAAGIAVYKAQGA
jgi:ornithine cyclodeaminase/alanine dehydrogenase-like protein (mu-crystallin family)